MQIKYTYASTSAEDYEEIEKLYSDITFAQKQETFHYKNLPEILMPKDP